jgi:uncharacterized protein (TIGR00730 family)
MNICVYGASSDLIDRIYLDAGRTLGQRMAERGHGLVFGAGATGMMGAAVRGVTEKDGRSIGVAPRFFDQPGVLYENCSEMIFTETMRQRKEIMEQRSDGFIMTPGGIGTYEEFFEILTLKQLGRHEKPIGILNAGGYFDDLAKLLEDTAAKGFMHEDCLKLYFITDDVEKLLDYMEGKTE